MRYRQKHSSHSHAQQPSKKVYRCFDHPHRLILVVIVVLIVVQVVVVIVIVVEVVLAVDVAVAVVIDCWDHESNNH